MTTETDTRLPTHEEVGQAVRMMRGLMEWSQETLAELSGLTVRSIQRTEAGQQVSTDTKRAIARAFGCDDLDFFMRPITAVSPEKLEAQKAAFDRDHLVLDAGLVDGRGIIRRLLEATGFRAIGPGNTVELPRSVEDAYAAILDFVRDCMDVMDVAGRAEMLGYGDQIDELAEPLSARWCAVAPVILSPRAGLGRRCDLWDQILDQGPKDCGRSKDFVIFRISPGGRRYSSRQPAVWMDEGPGRGQPHQVPRARLDRLPALAPGWAQSSA